MEIRTIFTAGSREEFLSLSVKLNELVDKVNELNEWRDSLIDHLKGDLPRDDLPDYMAPIDGHFC